MGTFRNYSCNFHKDLKRLNEFWLDYRAAFDVRLYPTIWRLRLLLSSRVWHPEKDTRIWEDTSGQIIGFAMLWRRQPASSYLVLDTFMQPKFVSDKLITAVLNWSDQRANEIAKEQKNPITVYAAGFSQYEFSVSNLQQHGYKLVMPNPKEHNVYFSRSLQKEIPPPPVPAGYEVHQLQSTDDLAAYQALYGFAQVNPHHQQELIESAEYCHLVLVNPQGELVAYCECSVCYAEWDRTQQQIGWIDYVETKSENRQKGFGRAILTAGLLRLKEMGADQAMLITINTNVPAVSLYNQTGFERVTIEAYPSYEKQIPFFA